MKSEDEPQNELPPLKEYKIGDLIGGKWKIHRILGGEGKSGMGIVYVCMSNYNINILALKTFQTAFLDSKKMKDNFKREALSWIYLEDHPHIVRAYWVQKLDYRLFILLEFIAPDKYGKNTLTHYLKEPISLQQALRWSIQFCEGMEHAASRGVTPHRDIKPDNIMIKMNKVLKITDFGLAKLFSSSGKVTESKTELQESGSRLTFLRTSGGKEVVGTLPWMAPEQFEGETDVRSDIYSFGLVMYQMMNRGNLPFYANSINGFEYAHKHAPVPKLNTKLFPIIARCLEKNPDNRYPDFHSLRMDLEILLYSNESEKNYHQITKKIEKTELGYAPKCFSLYALGLVDETIKACRKAIGINNLRGYISPKGAIRRYRLEYLKDLSDDAIKENSMKPDIIRKFRKDMKAKKERENPDLIMVYRVLGMALQDKGQWDEAIKIYRKAIAIKPDKAEAYRDMGDALYHKGQFDDAIKALEQAIAIKPDFAEAYHNMGLALQAKDLLDDAIKACKQAIAIKPDYDAAYLLMGTSFFAKEQYDDAIEALEQAIAIKPDDEAYLFINTSDTFHAAIAPRFII